MSVSGISSATGISQTNGTQARFKQVKNDFQQLGHALQAGDISAAQQAFAALQQLIPNLSTNNSQNPLVADMNTIGKALQSGDLTTAKSAFAKLQQDVQQVRKAHRHHHNKTAAYQDLASGLNATANRTNGSTGASQSIGQNLNILT